MTYAIAYDIIYYVKLYVFLGRRINMEINEIIKKIRLELCLSQEALAREIHVGFTSVNRWENNRAKPNQIARYALIELCKKKNLSKDLITALESIS